MIRVRHGEMVREARRNGSIFKTSTNLEYFLVMEKKQTKQKHIPYGNNNDDNDDDDAPLNC
jgi:hypothetical protein